MAYTMQSCATFSFFQWLHLEGFENCNNGGSCDSSVSNEIIGCEGIQRAEMYTGPDVQTLDIILRGWRVTHFDHCEHYGFIADSIQLKPYTVQSLIRHSGWLKGGLSCQKHKGQGHYSSIGSLSKDSIFTKQWLINLQQRAMKQVYNSSRQHTLTKTI